MHHADKKGIVYLVGTGPGDPGLITIRAIELIRRAEVLVYDHLANPKLLSDSPASSEKIYVGKEASKHTLAQEKIKTEAFRRHAAGVPAVVAAGGPYDPRALGHGSFL